MLARHGKRVLTVGTLIASLVIFGVINMTYYTEHLLPVLSPIIASSVTTLTKRTSSFGQDETAEDVSFHDKTIPWPEHWTTSLSQDQPAQILLTNFGWNHPNQTIGLTHSRSIRSRQLLEGIVSHPWFRPVSWDDVSSQPPNITTYVFLDVEMCFESNWPHYGGMSGYTISGFTDYTGGSNNDVAHNRSTTHKREGDCCTFQQDAMNEAIFQSPHTRLILFDCSGGGMRYCCVKNRNVDKTNVVSISASKSMHSDHDLGLPPPAGKPIQLSKQQVHDIETCRAESSRPLLYTFAGQFSRGNVRPHLQPFHNGKDVIVVKNTKQINMTYEDAMVKSKFVGTPRGDDLFSYRFTEAMSAGAIPVLHADGWVLPFSPDLIDWTKCAVLIPEAQVNDTISILLRISDKERCEMRKCVLNTYDRFMSSSKATIDGIIQSLEFMKNRNTMALNIRLNESYNRLKKQGEVEDRLPKKGHGLRESKLGQAVSAPIDNTNVTLKQLTKTPERSEMPLENVGTSSQATLKTPDVFDPSFSFNDKTIPWPGSWTTSSSSSPSILGQQEQSAQILLTNYGWNHPNQTKGLSYARSIRQSQLLKGVINHRWFRPVSWDKVSSQPTNITTYVFLDVEMCFPLNWPYYGGKGGLNVDVVGNRTTYIERYNCCEHQTKALAQPIFSSSNVRLILFDCSGDGMRNCCLLRRNIEKTSVISLSATKAMQSDHDLGLPPPPHNPVNMTREEIGDVEVCNETSRPLLYTFAGSLRRGDVRPKLESLHNGKDVLVVHKTHQVNMTYPQFLLSSKFTGTPKGDNLFSFRFAEAMSAGAIPVVHADDWALPFSTDLVDWSKCVVIIPEARVNDTISILSKITAEERCEMRKCVLDTYERFMSSPEATIDGIIQSLELIKARPVSANHDSLNESYDRLKKWEEAADQTQNLGHGSLRASGRVNNTNISLNSLTEDTEAPITKGQPFSVAARTDLSFSFNDNTIPWPESWTTSSPSVFKQQEQPAQILLTNYGWNHPDQTKGLSFARSIRQTQLLQGIVKHRWFRPVSWDDVSSQPTNVTTYVFLDVEMCFETNWPYYGGKGGLNVDVVGNRTTNDKRHSCCEHQTKALAQPIFSSPNVRLILFDCSGDGMRYCCLPQRNVEKTSVVSISATKTMQSDHDLGLPPPSGNPINMTRQEIHDVVTCNETSRPLLYTFAGSLRRGDVRPKLEALHNGKDVLVVHKTYEVNMTYSQFLTSSKFTGAPKGDNLFSYRFTEAMSAGAIPVVHADDWALPFSSRLINWAKCAVVIPEARVNETISILSKISPEERCEMRKCVLHAYNRFIKSPERIISGIIQSLELERKEKQAGRRRRRRRRRT